MNPIERNKLLGKYIKLLSELTYEYNNLKIKDQLLELELDIKDLIEIIKKLFNGEELSDGDKITLKYLYKQFFKIFFKRRGRDVDIDKYFSDNFFEDDFFDLDNNDDIDNLITGYILSKEIKEKNKEIFEIITKILIPVDLRDTGLNGLNINKDSNLTEINAEIERKIKTETAKLNKEIEKAKNIHQSIVEKEGEIKKLLEKASDSGISKKYKDKIIKSIEEDRIQSQQIIENKKIEINDKEKQAIELAIAEANRLYTVAKGEEKDDEAERKEEEERIAKIKENIKINTDKFNAEIEIIKKATLDLKNQSSSVKEGITIEKLDEIDKIIPPINRSFEDANRKAINLIDPILNRYVDLPKETKPDLKNILKIEFDSYNTQYEQLNKAISEMREKIRKENERIAQEKRDLEIRRALETSEDGIIEGNINRVKEVDDIVGNQLDTLFKKLKPLDKTDAKLITFKTLTTSNGGLPYNNHPFPEVIENIFSLSDYKSFKGGADLIDRMDVNSLIQLPNKWLLEHQKMYRDINLLKLLSLKPETISNFDLFKTDERKKKLLILILFWGAQNLINSISEKERNPKYIDLINNNLTEIQEIISKFQSFKSADIKNVGNTAKFVLTENLIRYYKSYSKSYITNNTNGNKYKDSFDSGHAFIFSLLVQDYMHWKQTQRNFEELKKVLKTIEKEIDIEYRKINEDAIKTYLKIRCDNPKPNYNQYFNIYTDSTLDRSKNVNSLYITGPDPNSNLSLYKKNINKTSANSTASIELNDDGTLKEIKKFDYGFLYGPFTRIFLPEDNNKNVSDNCQEILDSLTVKKKSVFVIGYGQSGAGKTSSLISREFKDDKGNVKSEDGIVLELLKNEKLDLNEIEVSIKELYSSQKKSNGIPLSDTISYDKIIFTRHDKTQEFTLDKRNNGMTGEYDQKVKIVKGNTIRWEIKTCKWKIIDGRFYHNRYIKKEKRKSNLMVDEILVGQIPDENLKSITLLSEFITTLVNEVRMVSPTPNNRQSSRSHVLIFFKIQYLGNSPLYLILGDLAGVENKFLCSEINTKKEFLNLRLPLETEDSTPYYVDFKFNEINPKDDNEKKVLDYYGYTKIEDIQKYPDGYDGFLINTKKKFIELNNMTSFSSNEDIGTYYEAVSNKINYIFEECKKILTTKLDAIYKNIDFNAKLIQKFKVDYDFSKNKYNNLVKLIKNKLPEDNSWVGYNCKYPIKKEEREVGFTTCEVTSKNQYNWYIDVSNYLKKNNYATKLIGNHFTNDILYHPYVINDYAPAKSLINTLNKNSHENNIKKLNEGYSKDGKDIQQDTTWIDHYFDLLEHNINTNTKGVKLDLNNIYSILEDDTSKFLNDLSLKDIYYCYNYFLQEKLDIESSDDKKKLYVAKYIILLKLKDLKLNTYDENKEDNTRRELISKIKEIKPNKIAELDIINKNIYQNIITNIDVYYKQIESRCDDREVEGQFINRSLYGMRKDLGEITKKVNRYALFQKLPLFNSPCIEYYCNSELYNCFKLPKNKLLDTNENAIFETISEVTKKEIPNIKDNISVVIFGVLNISRDVNDPPIMPYIDLTLLKQIRDKLNTNDQFDNNPDIIKDNIVHIKEENNKIFKILQNYEKSISSILIRQLTDKNEEIQKADNKNIYELLNEFIQILEEINSVSLLGTLDFLHSMKNSLQTDITCNIKNLDRPKREIAIKSHLMNYQNIITDENLNSVIIRHDESEPIESAKKVGGNYKQSLIKEYKQLIKMYKNL